MRWLWLVVMVSSAFAAGCVTCDHPITVYVPVQKCTAGYSSTGHCNGWTYSQKPVKTCPDTNRSSTRRRSDEPPPPSKPMGPPPPVAVGPEWDPAIEDSMWKVSYRCAQGATDGVLFINEKSSNGSYSGMLRFWGPKNNPQVPMGQHSIVVRKNPSSSYPGYFTYDVEPKQWAKRPEGYEMLRWSMSLSNQNERHMSGPIDNEGCEVMLLDRAN